MFLYQIFFIGSRGSANTQLYQPSAVIYDPNTDNLYIEDTLDSNFEHIIGRG